MHNARLTGVGRRWFDQPLRWSLFLLAGFIMQCDGCIQWGDGDSSSSGCGGWGGAGLDQPCGPEEPCARGLFGGGLSCREGICRESCFEPEDCSARSQAWEPRLGCRDGVCQPCTEDAHCVAVRVCDEEGACQEIPCTLDDECPADAFCDGSACAAQGGLGDACGGDPECLSGYCLGTICCQPDCPYGCMVSNCVPPHGSSCDPVDCVDNLDAELRIPDVGEPHVAANAAGDAVIAWVTHQSDGTAGLDARLVPVAAAASQVTLVADLGLIVDAADPALAVAADGSIAVVWRRYAPGGLSFEVIVQRFDAAGAAVASELLLNAEDLGWWPQPAIAVDGNGVALVAWQAADGGVGDNLDLGIVARRINAAGVPLGSEILVNSDPTGVQSGPAVAATVDGSAVIVWTETVGPEDTGRIVAQRLDGAGLLVGAELTLVPAAAARQHSPDVAMLPTGEIALAWTRDADGDDIFLGHFAADGTAIVPEMRVNEFVAGNQSDGFLATDSSGNLVVVYRHQAWGVFFDGIFARRYDAATLTWSSETEPNSCTCSRATRPQITIDDTGTVTAVWMAEDAGAGPSGIAVQRFDASGAATGVP